MGLQQPNHHGYQFFSPQKTTTVGDMTVKSGYFSQYFIFPVMTLSPWKFNGGKMYLMPERVEKKICAFFFFFKLQARSLSGISIQLNRLNASISIHLVVGFHCVEENLDCYCVCCP